MNGRQKRDGPKKKLKACPRAAMAEEGAKEEGWLAARCIRVVYYERAN